MMDQRPRLREIINAWTAELEIEEDSMSDEESSAHTDLLALPGHLTVASVILCAVSDESYLQDLQTRDVLEKLTRINPVDRAEELLSIFRSEGIVEAALRSEELIASLISWGKAALEIEEIGAAFKEFLWQGIEARSRKVPPPLKI